MKTWRRILFVITTLSLLASMLPVVHAAILGKGACGDNLTWKLDDAGILTISGTGPMTEYNSNDNSNDVPWKAFNTDIYRVLISYGVTTIANRAFESCVFMQSVTITSEVTKIGDYAFRGCSSLTSLILPDSLTELGIAAFANCTKIKLLVIPSSLKSISNSAFFHTGIQSLTIPEGVLSVDAWAFAECDNLESIQLPNGLEYIWWSAFSMCQKLKSAYIPASVKLIAEQAFDASVAINYEGSKQEWDEIDFPVLENNSRGKFAPQNIHYGRATKPESPIVTENMSHFQRKSAYTVGQFSDVHTSDWFATGVQTAYELGLMKGSSVTTFNPTGNLTVGEALAIACRILSIYRDNGQEFKQGSPWYQVYVDYAVANKIMDSVQLDPTKQITREQFAYLMCGAMPSPALNEINEITSIPDVVAKSTYGGFIYRLYNAGVLTGSDKFGTFKPTTAIQRSEVATIVTRMADKSQRKSFTLEIAVTEVQLAGKTNIMVGESTTWSAKAIPDNATNKQITWTAGNPGVATVDQNGKIVGIKPGQCNITASTPDGVNKAVLLTVTSNDPTDLQLAGKTNITVGEVTTWTAKVLPESAKTTVTWTAGNPSVATVDQSGTIFGLKAGQCNITASISNGIKRTVMVTVTGSGTVPAGSSGGVLSAEQIYAKCSPAVFYIEVYDAAGKAKASGSGFFIDSNGTAVTNYHVIKGAHSAKILRSDNKATYNVEGAYDYSSANDWAVIKIEGSGFPYLTRADASTIVGGASVYAIGSPQGLENTISEGIISNPNRVLDNVTYIQTTAAISHGSSGGALINKYGQVLGITSAGISEAENIGFALPVSVINGYKSSSITKFDAAWKANQSVNRENAINQLRDFILTKANTKLSSYPMYELSIPESSGNEYKVGLYYKADKDEVMLAVDYVTNVNKWSVIVDLPKTPSMPFLGYFYYSKYYDTNATFSAFGSINPATFSKESGIVFSKTDGIPTAGTVGDHQLLASIGLLEGLKVVDVVLFPSGYSRKDLGFLQSK